MVGPKIKLFPLLDYDERLYDAEMEEGYKNQQFFFNHPTLSRIHDWLTTPWYWLLYKYCEWRGHDLVDNGYATPDSGCIQMDCKRCGWSSLTHWLY